MQRVVIAPTTLATSFKLDDKKINNMNNRQRERRESDCCWEELTVELTCVYLYRMITIYKDSGGGGRGVDWLRVQPGWTESKFSRGKLNIRLKEMIIMGLSLGVAMTSMMMADDYFAARSSITPCLLNSLFTGILYIPAYRGRAWTHHATLVLR